MAERAPQIKTQSSASRPNQGSCLKNPGLQVRCFDDGVFEDLLALPCSCWQRSHTWLEMRKEYNKDE